MKELVFNYCTPLNVKLNALPLSERIQPSPFKPSQTRLRQSRGLCLLQWELLFSGEWCRWFRHSWTKEPLTSKISFSSLHQSSPLCHVIYSTGSIPLLQLWYWEERQSAKVSLQCSSVSLLHLLIHNLQLSPSIPLASYLLASTVSPSCNSPSVTTEGKKITS